jgi:hypothetical protein
MSTMILGRLGLKSSYASDKEAAIRAMATLIELDSGRYMPTFLNILIESIKGHDLCMLSETEIQIFHTPEGQIYHNSQYPHG